MNWEEFDRELNELAGRITDFTPDIVVGIARGGVIPASLLARRLNVGKMLVLSVDKKEEGRIVTAYLPDVTEKGILLVEDMLETGRSMMAAKEYLEEKRAQVKTACLYSMPISEMRPDYFLKEVPVPVRFPWE